MVESKTLHEDWLPGKPISFTTVSYNTGLDMLIYGSDLYRINKKGGKILRRFYILEDNSHILQWISPRKKPVETRLHLKDVKRICFGI